MMRFIVTIDDDCLDESLRCRKCGSDKNLSMFALDIVRDGQLIRTEKEAICAECFIKGMEKRYPEFRKYVHAPQDGAQASNEK